jgi:putative effector of murein hydrolase LrgA (UPF0299 family)
MILGRSVVHWIIVFIIAVCIFFVAQWLIPLIAGLIGLAVPGNIVNILALLIALGCFYGGYSYRRTP